MVLDERRSMIVQQRRDAEDAGLFKAGINKIVIDVIPELRRNNRKHSYGVARKLRERFRTNPVHQTAPPRVGIL